MSLLRRKPKIDRRQFPMQYVGPDNLWGLRTDTPCRVLGKRAGGFRIALPDGKIFTVARIHVRPPAPAR